jgi:hypothetical protein
MRQQFQLQVSLKTQNRPDALTPEQQAALLALRSKYEEKSLSLYSTEGVIADMSPIYQRHMTQTDVEAYIAFYSSPAGQRMVDVQPVIEKELMPVLMRQILAAQKEMTDQMKKDIDDCISANAPAQK